MSNSRLFSRVSCLYMLINMNRVVMVVSNACDPDPRVYKEARSLLEQGFVVTVYAWDRSCKCPPYEVKNGIVIKRIRLRSRAGYDSPITVLVTLPIFLLLAFLKMLQEKITIIHCHDLDTLIVGLLIKSIKKAFLIFDAREYYPSYVRTTMPEIIWRIVRVLYEVLPRKSDGVIIVNDYFKMFFNGCKRIVTVMNSPLSPMIHKVKKKRSPFRVIYYGGLSRDRGVIRLIASVADLLGTELAIAGEGELKENVIALSKKYANVDYLGWITEEEISSLVSSSDLIPILYDPKKINHILASPNKLFLAMAMGKPVIVYEGTIMERIIKNEKCGISISYDNTKKIEEAILMLKENKVLYNELSNNCVRAFNEKYKWEIMEKRLISLYRSLIIGRASSKARCR